MSQFQLIPYNRVEDHFMDQVQVPISSGSFFNFNKEAYDHLDHFEQWVKRYLAASGLVHVDETEINMGTKRIWLQNTSN